LEDSAGLTEIVRYDPQPAETELAKRLHHEFGVCPSWPDQEIDVGCEPGCPCHATANPPTTRNSTLFALSNSLNSRKSLLSGIRVNPRLKLKYDGYPLFGGHRKVVADIRRLSVLDAAEKARCSFHYLNSTSRKHAKPPQCLQKLVPTRGD
jgi:hypothetical protein